MSRRYLFAATLLAVILTAAALVQSTHSTPSANQAYAAGPDNKPFVRTIEKAGTTKPETAPLGADRSSGPEVLKGADLMVNRSFTRGTSAQAPAAISTPSARGRLPLVALNTSFDGLNHRDQRLSNGGNAFSLEPPDQGLCTDGTKVVEVINDVLRVYDTSGSPLTGVVSLNPFLGYRPAINRMTGVFGPFVFDPSCFYDVSTNRWFLDADTLETKPATGAFTGRNHLDLAVSNTSDPTGLWTIYRLPVQDDGSQHTPKHHCPLNNNGTGKGPCLGDYPHLGVDANGVYLTTNEYPLVPTNFQFHAAQIYAFSKTQLVALASKVRVVQFDTLGMVGGFPGFTIWPAISAGGVFDSTHNGVEYFLSSNAAEEANYPNGVAGSSNHLIEWALSNTASLNTPSPAPVLNLAVFSSKQYNWPPPSNQKTGNIPLGDCLNDLNCSFFAFGGPDNFAPEVEASLASNDTRMQQVVFADGFLWAALDTGLNVSGATQAGIYWFIVSPGWSGSSLTASLSHDGYLAGAAGQNLTYPAFAATTAGKGIMAFTIVGSADFPSAGYIDVDSAGTVGSIAYAKAGVGPDDGFTAYKFFSPFAGYPDTRWGDYGAAVPAGTHIWIASEYIGQACTYLEYTTHTAASPFGSCTKTRTTLANWYTRITDITP